MTDSHGVARDQLRAFVERIERLEEEKKTIADDIKDVYGEAKAMGFDTKILKMVISLRKKDEQQRTEEEIILDTYMQALGMVPVFEQEEKRPATREERRRQIMSEDMADHKALVDKMADAGLISEEARHENKAPADAVASKFGNGLHNPELAPASQGEADAPSEEVSPSKTGQPIRPTDGIKASAANVGGDYVTETPRSADIRPGLVSNPPAHHPLRPNCKNPGSQCAGYGSKLCHACAVAVRELETA